MSKTARPSWEKVKLSELCTITRGSSPRPIIEWVSDVGTPWVKISDATSQPGRYISSTKECIKNDARSKSVVVTPGDLIVSNSATPGLPKFMKIEACIHDGWLLFRNFRDVLPEFLYYVVLNDREKLVAKGSGSVFTNLKTEILKNHEICLPSISEQKFIAEILGDIDDLIQMNAELNSELEEVAKTIFKSWFVDFDPVKAKMAGEKPAGMDEATASLFPDSLEDSELGPIPTGWDVRTIGTLCESLLGGTPSRSRAEFWGGDIPWINSGKINDFRITTPSEYITREGLEKSATKLLPVGTTVLAITGATLGQFSRIEISTCANQSVVGVIGSENASNEFVYSNIKSGIQRLIASQTGGAQQHINKEDVNNFAITYPGLELVEIYTSTVREMFLLIGQLSHQSLKLEELRDALLPRLISGELQIPEEMLVS
jgi:type I restriction enzyme S subunit